MNSNQEILDDFGRLLVKEVYDDQLRFINNDINDLKQTKQFENLFYNLNEQGFNELKLYTKEILSGSLFNFLRVFEENEQFKLYFEENEQKVNLVKISEMLKAEPAIENGWIERFSKELNNEK
ncbi:hypothetical protein [Confluentibacter sediminis]|uniref:hypothetical protein n=1 Tax=Confluentibacter sediminis TaxID=2219045 RepID=UPI000DADBE45|nr:hypothetical protein [Confluentibacter sediminis]